jgi:hypothetical protein
MLAGKEELEFIVDNSPSDDRFTLLQLRRKPPIDRDDPIDRGGEAWQFTQALTSACGDGESDSDDKFRLETPERLIDGGMAVVVVCCIAQADYRNDLKQGDRTSNKKMKMRNRRNKQGVQAPVLVKL